ncbi:RecQ family ATP-dependent DNA helicase [Microbacterium oleivorans]|uniref:ATP-dependent DNA helicase RecQ n=1 Tax=Microbacterium oleivorans TaxID=273677 RepID=A0A4R5YJ64_9MICO|nr:RecQ family ATP-dependent DNA helicase [Microbacterium oleivorans]TDL45405.1 ATP-dependent DNA helicase RecQ [Microbacterium oleivorans]
MPRRSTPASSAPDRAEVERVAAERFGLTHLRPAQLDAIEAAAGGRDVLVVWATGSGKSAVYQVTAALRPGVTVVVSPLIALQEDQLAGLEHAPDAPKAVALNSGRGEKARAEAWRRLREGEATYVLLAPEQLANDEVVADLATLDIALLAVDEAHCIASWGHDFRPDYLGLGEVAERLGRPPILALTATASTPVREEIAARLGLDDPSIHIGDVDRPSIRLGVRRHGDDREKRAAVVDEVASLPVPGLLYTSTRRSAEQYADDLTERGKRARAYHAGLPSKERAEVHRQFLCDELDVVVATSAFGMGIDKENVRFVIHADVPESIDAYFQELGRAGRDGEEAHGTLHYRAEDLALRRYFATKNPDAAELRTLMRAMSTRARLKSALAKESGLSPRRVTGLLTLLIDTGSARASKSGVSLRRNLDERAAVKAALERVEERERIERSRIETMREYAETRRCRRQVLLGYFGQDLDEPCGNCDTCAAGAADVVREPASASEAGFEIDEKVSHREWGAGTVVSIDDDRMRVFFDSEGYKVLSLEIVEREHLLKAG